jgi:hypothetical protein
VGWNNKFYRWVDPKALKIIISFLFCKQGYFFLAIIAAGSAWGRINFFWGGEDKKK